MKKIVFLFSLLLLFIPTIVLADSAGPSILGYDAVVTNKNGVKIQYDGKSYTIKYNTKVHVYAEYDGEASCELSTKQNNFPDYFSISLKDLAPLKKEVFPKDLEKVDNQGSTLKKTKETFIVLNNKGAKLSKGPADVYGKYDQILPYETVVHSSYIIEAEGIGYSYWYYIDDNGYKGWLDMSLDDYGILIADDMLTFNSADIKNKDGSVITKIPSEEKIEEIYSGNKKYYLKYNENSGYITKNDSFDIGFKSQKGYILTLYKTNIISMDGEVKGIIPAGEKVKILYAQADDLYGEYYYHATGYVMINDKGYFYVEYNGVKGFVEKSSVRSLYYEYKTKTVDIDAEKDFYELEMINSEIHDEESYDEFIKRFKKVERIPKSATVTYYDISTLYDSKNDQDIMIELVKYKGKLGCIASIVKDESDIKTTPLPTPVVTYKPIITPSNTNNIVSNKNDNIILYCIIGASIFAIASIGTIIVINKNKKKNKKDTSKEKVSDKKNKE